jgi:ABC-2 type transport system permease protein
MPQIVNPSVTADATNLSDEDMLLQLKEVMKDPDNEDSLKIKMDRATAVTIDTSHRFTIRPALVTAGKGVWMKQGDFVTDSAEILYDPKAGDVQGSFPTMTMLTRKTGAKEQRILVSGDADFMSNSRLIFSAFLVKALYSWLDHNNFPIYAPNPKLRDGKLLISNSGVNVMTIIYVWVLPALVLMSGAVLLIRRKRK